MEQQASGGVPVLVEKIDTAEVESQSGAPPVYSAMTPATIQNEKGEIQHVYVTYDQQGTIQAINEHPGNSLGGSVVTITYPTPDSLPQQHQVGMPGVPVTGDLQLHTETSQPMVQEPVQVSTVPRPHVNSLVPGRFQFNFRLVIFRLTLVNCGWGITYEITLRWTPLDLTDDKSTLVLVMAWCRQAASHYLSQC